MERVSAQASTRRILTHPCRQIFPNAAPPQDTSTHSAAEASMALLREQEAEGSGEGDNS